MVTPSTTPEISSGISASFLVVAVLSLPGALLDIWVIKASKSIFTPDGKPSSVQPTAGPWLSPKTDNLILFPTLDFI